MGRWEGARSAKTLLAQTLPLLAARYGQRFEVLGNSAVADRSDQNAMVMFRSVIDGRPIRGVAEASIAGGVGWVTVAFDLAERPLEPLLAELKRGLGQGRAVTWRNVPLPDGTGTIRLPEGWRVVSANTPQAGAITAEGPQGSVELGYAMQMIGPEAIMPGMPVHDMLPVAPYSNPTQAVRDVFLINSRISQRTGGPAMQWGRVIDSEPAPAPAPASQAAFIQYGWQRVGPAGAQDMQTLALVVMSPVGFGSWLYYTSQVSAPSASFSQNLPVLAEIWKSWRVSDHVHTSRLLKACQSQREAMAIQQEAYDNQQRTSDRVWSAWSEYFRGQQAVFDRDRNEVRHLDLRWADEIVRQANRLEGTERWQLVTPFSLDY